MKKLLINIQSNETTIVPLKLLDGKIKEIAIYPKNNAIGRDRLYRHLKEYAIANSIVANEIEDWIFNAFEIIQQHSDEISPDHISYDYAIDILVAAGKLDRQKVMLYNNEWLEEEHGKDWFYDSSKPYGQLFAQTKLPQGNYLEWWESYLTADTDTAYKSGPKKFKRKIACAESVIRMPGPNAPGLIKTSCASNLNLDYPGTTLWDIYFELLVKADPAKPMKAAVDLRDWWDNHPSYVDIGGYRLIPSYNKVKEVLGLIKDKGLLIDPLVLSSLQLIESELDKIISDDDVLIEIIKKLQPTQFYEFVQYAAARKKPGSDSSLLARLYATLNGKEFQEYLAIYNIKILAYAAGRADNVEKTINERKRSVSFEYYDYEFLSSKPHPYMVNYNSRGNVDVLWRSKEYTYPLAGVKRIEMYPIDIIAIRIHLEDETEMVAVMTAPEVIRLRSDFVRKRGIIKLSIISIFFGVSGAMAARTLMGKLSQTMLGVVIPVADLVISKNIKKIQQMNGGEEFLMAWSWFNNALLAYDLVGLARTVSKVIRARYVNKAKVLSDNNPGDEIASGVLREATKVNTHVENKVRKISELKAKVDDIPEALKDGGVSDTHVYLGISDGEIVYVGITKQAIKKRQNQHRDDGKTFEIGQITYSSPMYRRQARAIEQVIYVLNKEKKLTELGGVKVSRMFNIEFENKIGSIAEKHDWYDDAVEWGENWLKLKNYLKID